MDQQSIGLRLMAHLDSATGRKTLRHIASVYSLIVGSGSEDLLPRLTRGVSITTLLQKLTVSLRDGKLSVQSGGYPGTSHHVITPHSSFGGSLDTDALVVIGRTSRTNMRSSLKSRSKIFGLIRAPLTSNFVVALLFDSL